jgi:hypothetical protein
MKTPHTHQCPVEDEDIIATEQCFCCGNDLEEGFVEKLIDGQVEYVCGSCVDGQGNDDEARYEAADTKFTEMFEDGEI